MYEQHRIPSTLSDPETLARVKALVAAAGSASRIEISRRVCVLLGFLDARGRPQLASCMRALRALDAAGHIRLPAPRHNHRRCRQLHRVIGLSRFLIRPSVRCQNLASKALGLALRRLPDDCQLRYGYRPLLVDTLALDCYSISQVSGMLHKWLKTLQLSRFMQWPPSPFTLCEGPSGAPCAG